MPNIEIIVKILPILCMGVGITLTPRIVMMKVNVYFKIALDFILNAKVS